jgi:aspartyl-tRNA(Asn)/glutamyl-tRNA(Gln) amidotransferase subunit C
MALSGGFWMKLTQEQVKHVAWLARLGLTKAEIEIFRFQLSNILENFAILEQADTTDAPLATQSIPLRNIFREDEVADSFPRDEILANAPREEEGCFKVQAILE